MLANIVAFSDLKALGSLAATSKTVKRAIWDDKEFWQIMGNDVVIQPNYSKLTPGPDGRTDPNINHDPLGVGPSTPARRYQGVVSMCKALVMVSTGAVGRKPRTINDPQEIYTSLLRKYRDFARLERYRMNEPGWLRAISYSHNPRVALERIRDTLPGLTGQEERHVKDTLHHDATNFIWQLAVENPKDQETLLSSFLGVLEVHGGRVRKKQ